MENPKNRYATYSLKVRIADVDKLRDDLERGIQVAGKYATLKELDWDEGRMGGWALLTVSEWLQANKADYLLSSEFWVWIEVIP